jgi:hypothetical protein
MFVGLASKNLVVEIFEQEHLIARVDIKNIL